MYDVGEFSPCEENQEPLIQCDLRSGADSPDSSSASSSTSVSIGDKASNRTSPNLSFSEPVSISAVRTEKRSRIVFESIDSWDSPPGAGSSTAPSRKKSKAVTQPLIVVKDSSDPVAVRRARNTEAARRSRARKNERIVELEQLVEVLQGRIQGLQAEVNVLRKIQGI